MINDDEYINISIDGLTAEQEDYLLEEARERDFLIKEARQVK